MFSLMPATLEDDKAGIAQVVFGMVLPVPSGQVSGCLVGETAATTTSRHIVSSSYCKPS